MAARGSHLFRWGQQVEEGGVSRLVWRTKIVPGWESGRRGLPQDEPGLSALSFAHKLIRQEH